MFHSLEAMHQAVTPAASCPALPSTMVAPWHHPNVGRTGQVANDKMMEGEDGCLDKMFFVMDGAHIDMDLENIIVFDTKVKSLYPNVK